MTPEERIAAIQDRLDGGKITLICANAPSDLFWLLAELAACQERLRVAEDLGYAGNLIQADLQARADVAEQAVAALHELDPTLINCPQCQPLMSGVPCRFHAAEQREKVLREALVSAYECFLDLGSCEGACEHTNPECVGANLAATAAGIQNSETDERAALAPGEGGTT